MSLVAVEWKCRADEIRWGGGGGGGGGGWLGMLSSWPAQLLPSLCLSRSGASQASPHEGQSMWRFDTSAAKRSSFEAIVVMGLVLRKALSIAVSQVCSQTHLKEKLLHSRLVVALRQSFSMDPSGLLHQTKNTIHTGKSHSSTCWPPSCANPLGQGLPNRVKGTGTDYPGLSSPGRSQALRERFSRQDFNSDPDSTARSAMSNATEASCQVWLCRHEQDMQEIPRVPTSKSLGST